MMAKMIPPAILHEYPIEGERQAFRRLRDYPGMLVLQAAGRVHFALSDAEGGRLAPLRVEAVALAIVQIPASRIARPFEAEL